MAKVYMLFKNHKEEESIIREGFMGNMKFKPIVFLRSNKFDGKIGKECLSLFLFIKE